MKTEVTKIESREQWLALRSKNINSTDASCLFDANPYTTKFELWHKLKSGEQQEITQTERMSWGNALEAAIATEAARVNNWQIEPFKDYIHAPELKIGSSFDFKIAPPLNALLEVKNVDIRAFSKNWTDDGVLDDGTTDGEAPIHIEIQVQHQMLLTGLTAAYICALVGGNELKIYKRQANASIQAAIIKKSAEFWKSIEENSPPQIDYERDSEFIISIYNHAEPNKTLQATPDIDALVHGYNTVSAAIKDLESQKEMWKAKILEVIGDAEKVKSPEYSISAGIIPGAEIAFTRKPYRSFKVTKRNARASSEA